MTALSFAFGAGGFSSRFTTKTLSYADKTMGSDSSIIFMLGVFTTWSHDTQPGLRTSTPPASLGLFALTAARGSPHAIHSLFETKIAY